MRQPGEKVRIISLTHLLPKGAPFYFAVFCTKRVYTQLVWREVEDCRQNQPGSFVRSLFLYILALVAEKRSLSPLKGKKCNLSYKLCSSQSCVVSLKFDLLIDEATNKYAAVVADFQKK